MTSIFVLFTGKFSQDARRETLQKNNNRSNFRVKKIKKFSNSLHGWMKWRKKIIISVHHLTNNDSKIISSFCIFLLALIDWYFIFISSNQIDHKCESFFSISITNLFPLFGLWVSMKHSNYKNGYRYIA